LAVPTTTALRDRRGLLGAAKAGDQDAFSRLVEPHRRELTAHCYRMLGSLHDAEDALQDTLLRAWRGLAGTREQTALRAWLYRIATNACLDAIARRPKRMLPLDYSAPSHPDEDPGPPVLESVWIEPYPDEALAVTDGYASPEARYEQREAVELAFVAALQHLPARQRAVLILRDVLGLSAREVADSLETTTVSVNSALQRARKTLEDRLPDRNQQTSLRELGDEQARRLIEDFLGAWERYDFAAVAAMLADDAVFSMPPYAIWWRGRDEIMEFVRRAIPNCPGSRYLPAHANAQAAVAAYNWEPEAGCYLPAAVIVFTFEGVRVTDMTSFATPDIFPRFDLPAQLSA
jgi:RNA polymerase sigma-70 factor (ECF subfamily)